MESTDDRLRANAPLLLAPLAIAGVTGVTLPFRAYLDTVDVLVFYLVAVTGIALVADLRSSIAGALTAFLAFNFFFTTPYHTFFVANTHDVLALGAFLGLSILISRLVVQARSRTREALRHSRQTEMLYQLSVALIHSNELDVVLASIVERVQHMFELDGCAVLLDADGDFHIGAATGTRLDLDDPHLLAAARRSLAQGDASGAEARAERTPPASGVTPLSAGAGRLTGLLIPILTVEEPLGILLVARAGGRRPFDDDERRLLVTFANQAAVAIERSLLTEERTRAEVLSRTDELRKALLSAVSHDLRTPLASIKASVTTLLQRGVAWSDADRRDLLEAIDEETDRLDRLVSNLLDLSRIEAGALKLARDWYEPSEVVAEVTDRFAWQLEGRELTLELPTESTLIDVDFVMISEVLANILENALRYAPPDTPLRILARKRDGMLEFSVEDRGTGIPTGEEERIFDKFYRVENQHRTGGSGMGLAISRGFVQAHGGQIWARRNPAGGTTVAFTVPLADTEGLAVEASSRRTAPS